MAAESSAYAIGSDNKLYAWGDNTYGELGNGTMDRQRHTPSFVSLPTGVEAGVTIAGGGGVGYAIGSDGNLYSWGLNADGQLGDGTTNNSDTPVLVSMPTGVTAKAITGGGAFAHIIGSDGNLYGWGLGTQWGQLGVIPHRRWHGDHARARHPCFRRHAKRHFGQPAHRLRHRVRWERLCLGLRRGR